MILGIYSFFHPVVSVISIGLLVGFLLYLIFEKADRLSEKAAEHVPVIVRETVCGVLIALMGLFIPIALFSGEEQMAELMKDYGRRCFL